MQRGQLKVRIPNPHQSDISVGLLKRILKEAGGSLQELEHCEAKLPLTQTMFSLLFFL